MGEYRRLPADEELTVERTAEQVDALGGRGAARVCDCGVEGAVEAMVADVFAADRHNCHEARLLEVDAIAWMGGPLLGDSTAGS